MPITVDHGSGAGGLLSAAIGGGYAEEMARQQGLLLQRQKLDADMQAQQVQQQLAWRQMANADADRQLKYLGLSLSAYDQNQDRALKLYLANMAQDDLVDRDLFNAEQTSRQNALDRALKESLQTKGFEFQQGESALDRSFRQAMQREDFGFRRDESSLDRAFRERMQQAGFDFQGGESALDRELRQQMQQEGFRFQGGESSLERDLRRQMQQEGFRFQGNESFLDRALRQQMQQAGFDFQGGESALDRGLRRQMQQEGFNFQDNQSAMDRDFRERMQRNQMLAEWDRLIEHGKQALGLEDRRARNSRDEFDYRRYGGNPNDWEERYTPTDMQRIQELNNSDSMIRAKLSRGELTQEMADEMLQQNQMERSSIRPARVPRNLGLSGQQQQNESPLPSNVMRFIQQNPNMQVGNVPGTFVDRTTGNVYVWDAQHGQPKPLHDQQEQFLRNYESAVRTLTRKDENGNDIPPSAEDVQIELLRRQQVQQQLRMRTVSPEQAQRLSDVTSELREIGAHVGRLSEIINKPKVSDQEARRAMSMIQPLLVRQSILLEQRAALLQGIQQGGQTPAAARQAQGAQQGQQWKDPAEYQPASPAQQPSQQQQQSSPIPSPPSAPAQHMSPGPNADGGDLRPNLPGDRLDGATSPRRPLGAVEAMSAVAQDIGDRIGEIFDFAQEAGQPRPGESTAAFRSRVRQQEQYLATMTSLRNDAQNVVAALEQAGGRYENLSQAQKAKFDSVMDRIRSLLRDSRGPTTPAGVPPVTTPAQPPQRRTYPDVITP